MCKIWLAACKNVTESARIGSSVSSVFKTSICCTSTPSNQRTNSPGYCSAKYLSRWVGKFITMSLRMERSRSVPKGSEMKQSQGFRGFHILLHSSVYFSQPTYKQLKVKYCPDIAKKNVSIDIIMVWLSEIYNTRDDRDIFC